jgi:hypothetical protein
MQKQTMLGGVASWQPIWQQTERRAKKMLTSKRFVRRRVKLLIGLAGCILILALLDIRTAPLVNSQAGSPMQDELAAERDAQHGAEQPNTDLIGDSQPEPNRIPAATASDMRWLVTYGFWQGGISSVSNWDDVSPAHGRSDVEAHAEKIRAVAPRMLELLVAAAIAHQASDLKDRPFGTDAVENFWVDYVDPDASVGIAQLRPSEVAEWFPELAGCDLLDPYNAVMVMTAKLTAADSYIRKTYGDLPVTDRYMLLALVQNTSDRITMKQTVDYFVHDAGRDWEVMLLLEEGQQRDWREQLRLILLQVDWLIEQNWSTPPDLDLDYWRVTAFGT